MLNKRGELTTVLIGLVALIVFTSALIIGKPTITGLFHGPATPTACGEVNESLTLTSNISTIDTCFVINSSNVVLDCDGFMINGSASEASPGTAIGINATDVNNITIKDCIVKRFSRGILLNNVSDGFIINTNVTNGFSRAIQVNGRNLTITNSTVMQNTDAGNNNGIGVLLQGNNLTFSNNNLSIDEPTASGGNVLALNGVDNSTFVNNIIAFIGAGNGAPLDVAGSGNNFTNNTFSTSTSGVTTMNLGTASSNIFVNTTIRTGGNWIVTGGSSTGNSLANTTFDSATDGSIRIVPNVTIPVSTTVNLQRLNITFARAFLNSSALNFLNATALISLKGISFALPKIRVDYEDDGTSVDCPQATCANLSYSGGIFVFNVSSFTTYSVEENSSFIISACQINITFPGRYNLSGNINSSGENCITINASNVFVNCLGFNITGSGTGSGVHLNMSLTSNVTVANCRISNFNRSIFLGLIHNSTIENNTLLNGTQGINGPVSVVNSIVNVVIKNNTIRSMNLGFNPSGISLGGATGTTANLTIINNDINGSQFAGMSLSIENSFLTNNSVDGGDLFGIGIDGSSFNHNLITGNYIILRTQNQLGFRLLNSARNNTFRNNTFNINGSGSNTQAMSFSSSIVYNNTFASNRIIGNPQYGVVLDGSASPENSIENNSITSFGSYGIYITSTTRHRVIGNLISGPSIAGIYLTSSSSSVFYNNTIANTSTGIYFTLSDRNVFNLTRIENVSLSINISDSSSNNFTHVVFINPFDSFEQGGTSNSNSFDNLTYVRRGNFNINFPSQINVSGNVSNRTVELRTDIAAINTTETPSINRTANISVLVSRCPATIFAFETFTRNVSQIRQQGTICDSSSNPSCTNIICSGNRLNFTASHFSSFAAGTACGDVNESTALVNSVSSTGTCFNITGSNLTLDCSGFTVTYGTSTVGNGVKATGRNNITIRNCLIIKGSGTDANNIGIDFSSINDSLLVNNTIRTNGTDHNYGIQLVNSNRSGIENNTIRTQGSTDRNYGIYLFSNTTNVIARGNSITTNGSGADFGIAIESSSVNNTVINNTLFGLQGDYIGVFMTDSALRNRIVGNVIISNSTKTGLTNRGMMARINSHNNSIENNSISSTAGQVSNVGIEVTESTGSRIRGNAITVNGSDNNYGVYLYTSANNSLVENNTISASGSSSLNVGIWLYDTVFRSVIERNIISTDGTSDNYGIAVDTSVHNNTIINNTITTRGSGSRNYGILVNISTNNTLELNTIVTNGSSSNNALHIDRSNKNTFNFNNLTTQGSASFAISIVNSNSSFNNTILTRPIEWISSGANSFGNLTNTTFLAVNGSARFPGLLFINGSQAINISRLNITQNRVFLNSTNLSFMNTSAVISLFGITFSTPFIGVDFEDDGTFIGCLAPSCVNLSYSGNVFVFNVSSFTTYIATAVQLASPTSCGFVTQSLTLTSNINVNGSCFTINATNMTFDCSGFLISGNLSGVGINATNRLNITIRNCFVENFSNNILIKNVNDSFFYNNTARNSSSDNFLITDSSNNLMANSTGSSQTSAGFAVGGSLNNNNTIVNNNGTGVGNTGMALAPLSNSTVINNTGSSISGSGFILDSGSRNLAINNTGRSTSSEGFTFSASTNSTLINNIGFSTSSTGVLLSDIHNSTLINTTGTSSSSTGISLQGSNNLLIDSLGTSNTGTGFIIQSSQNNVLINNTAMTNSSSAVQLQLGAVNNSLTANRLVSTNGISIEIISGGTPSENNSFFNTTLMTNFTWLFTASDSIGNNITNTTFNSTNGSINIPTRVTIPISTNATLSKLNVSFNRAFLNSTNLTFLNTSAVISLSGITFSTPFVGMDLEDDGIFFGCPAPRCVNISYSGNVFVFNVSSFTTYIATAVQLASPTSCGMVTSNLTLGANIQVNGSCFSINTSNLFLNCSGFSIGGNGSGIGINATDVLSVTIRDCVIENFTNNIWLLNTNDSFLINNTARNSSSTGLALTSSFRNLLANNTVSNNGSVAIGLVSGSNYNSLTNNIATSDSNVGILFSLSSNNTLTNNTAISNSHRGVSLSSSPNNTLNLNRVTSNFIGIAIAASSDNILLNNTAISDGGKDIDLSSTSLRNVFLNTTLRTNTTWIATDSASSENRIVNTLFEAANGSIRILPNVTLSTSATVNLSNLNISFNKAFLNSSSLTFLNTSAEITLRGLTFATAFAAVDFEDDGTFFGCTAPRCVNLSYTGGTFVFNVSSFTAYISTSSLLSTPSSCGTITQNTTLNTNINVNGSCFIVISTSNVFLDCANNRLTGNGTGTGIYVNGSNNVVIRNCYIENFSTATSYESSNNSAWINNTIANQTDVFINMPATSLNNSFTNTTFSLSPGSINYATFVLNNSANISHLNFEILRGLAAVNSSQNNAINTSATVTLLNIPSANNTVYLLEDFNLNPANIIANGSVCPSSVCTGSSYNSITGTFTFSAARFSSFALGPAVAAAAAAEEGAKITAVAPARYVPCPGDWRCTDWSACPPNGLQTRTCVNQTGCLSSKPAEIQGCVYAPPTVTIPSITEVPKVTFPEIIERFIRPETAFAYWLSFAILVALVVAIVISLNRSRKITK